MGERPAGRPLGKKGRGAMPPALGAAPTPTGASGGGRRPSGFSTLLLHLHPRTVPEDALALRRTFALGGVAVVLLVLLLASGTLLLLRYDSSPERAWASVREIAQEAPFGGFIRNVHHWSVIGGALLRAARGGAEIGAPTLARFFVLHVAIVPILLLLLTSWHFWLVRKGGGVMLPRPSGGGPPRRAVVSTSPHLVLREGVAALVAVAAVLLLAAVADAPLLAQANPGMSPNPAKAPWYFMGLQELLVHLHPAFAVLVLAGVYALVRRALAATRLEAVQATFTFVVVAFVVLTVVGTAFRGAGMALALPWAAAASP